MKKADHNNSIKVITINPPTKEQAEERIKLHAISPCTTMNENVVQGLLFCAILNAHGTRPGFFAATSARIKLVFALPLNHKLSHRGRIAK